MTNYRLQTNIYRKPTTYDIVITSCNVMRRLLGFVYDTLFNINVKK